MAWGQGIAHLGQQHLFHLGRDTLDSTPHHVIPEIIRIYITLTKTNRFFSKLPGGMELGPQKEGLHLLVGPSDSGSTVVSGSATPLFRSYS